MAGQTSRTGDRVIVERPDLQHLLDALLRRGYRVVGPTVRDGAIVYDELTKTADLPVGWTDEQEGGTYRLKKRTDEKLFGYVVGPHSWKKFLHPPVLRLWQAKRAGNGFQIQSDQAPPPKFAFLGVRSCELHAIAIQDKVFLKGPYVDPTYQARREQAFVIAVQCGQAGGTCFCVSMNTGPKATFGFDLALTEVLESGRHYFVTEIGSERGADVMRDVPCRQAAAAELASAERCVEEAAGQMGRAMDSRDLKDLLYRNYEHPRWDEVADRCLSCSNCTMVCPKCGAALDGAGASWHSPPPLAPAFVLTKAVRPLPSRREHDRGSREHLIYDCKAVHSCDGHSPAAAHWL